jgi:hypothetical protein
MAKYKPEDEGKYRVQIKSFLDLFDELVRVFDNTRETGNTDALLRQKGTVVFVNKESANAAVAKFKEVHGPNKDHAHATFLNEIKDVKIFENLKTPLFYDNGAIYRLLSKCSEYMRWMLGHLQAMKQELDGANAKIKRQSINDDRYTQLIQTEVEYKHLKKDNDENLALAKALTTKLKATYNMTFWQRFAFLWKGEAWLKKNITRE